MNWDQLETIFFAALALPAGDRAAYLSSHVPDSAARTEVDAMLAAHDSGGLDIESKLLAVDEPIDLVGRRLGPYRLCELIGRGGMGEVYLARRDDKLYEREVAVKLVRHDPTSRLPERFARERTILARLVHPNVATLYDGGFADDGRPFLVMEYVEGQPVTTWCDERRLGLRERLRLFARICEAVQFAHGALVIHRDLKPANILVDEQGEPKLLDFGIARLMADEEAGATIALDRILTPEHAAPEQILGAEPTTATDVYALGVLLCELLAGDRPLEFPTRSPTEIDRIAREVEATPPSRLIASATPEEAAARASTRGTTPGRLRAILRGDLDAICAKALRKEPKYRYAGPGDLVADVRRHLESRPVAAARGNRTYIARKFVRRHFVSLALAVAAFTVLAGFLFVSLRQGAEVARQRDLAKSESERAELVLKRLVGLFETAGPQAAGASDVLDVADFLRRGDEALAFLANDPPARSRLAETLARIHSNRGHLQRASALFETAIADAVEPRRRIRLQHEYAMLKVRYGGSQAAEPLLRESLRRHRQLLGQRHPDTIQAELDLATTVRDRAEARAMLTSILDGLAADDFAGANQQRASALNALATLDIEAGRTESAESRLLTADSLLVGVLPATAPARMTIRHNLAGVYIRLGRWQRAESMQRQLVADRRKISGAVSDLTAQALESHAVILANLGRHREAGDLLAEVLDIFESTLVAGHRRTTNAARNVGQLLSIQERYDEALPYFDRAVAARAIRGEPNLNMRAQRALVLLGLDRAGDAWGELDGVVRAMEEPGSDTKAAYRAEARLWLGVVDWRLGRTAEARESVSEALRLRRENLAADHPALAEAELALAALDGHSDPASRRIYDRWGLAHPLIRQLIDSVSP